MKMSRILAVLSLTFISACGSGISDDLAGAWVSACTDSVIYRATFTESTFVATATPYSNTSCTAVTSFRQTYTYSYSGGDDVDQPEGAKTLDYTVSKVEITPLTTTEANGRNSVTACGFSDWAVNVPKDITSGCGGPSSAGETTYDIYKIDNGRLFTGDLTGSNDGTTASKRPTGLQSISLSKE